MVVTCPACGEAEFVQISAAVHRDGVHHWAASCTGCGHSWVFDD